jgi:hypothetical protein
MPTPLFHVQTNHPKLTTTTTTTTKCFKMTCKN